MAASVRKSERFGSHIFLNGTGTLTTTQINSHAKEKIVLYRSSTTNDEYAIGSLANNLIYYIPSNAVHSFRADIGLDTKLFEIDAGATKGIRLYNGSNYGLITTNMAADRTYTLPDTGANSSFIMSDLAQTINGVKTFSSALKTSLISNQIILGTTNTTTINATAPVASRVYTIPDTAVDSSFIMSDLAQTINGVKTFSSAFTNSLTSNQIVLGTTNTTTINATAPASSRVYTIPDTTANSSFVMTDSVQTINGAKTFTSGITAASLLLTQTNIFAGEFLQYRVTGASSASVVVGYITFSADFAGLVQINTLVVDSANGFSTLIAIYFITSVSNVVTITPFNTIASTSDIATSTASGAAIFTLTPPTALVKNITTKISILNTTSTTYSVPSTIPI
jgi:hypothetical protein